MNDKNCWLYLEIEKNYLGSFLIGILNRNNLTVPIASLQGMKNIKMNV